MIGKSEKKKYESITKETRPADYGNFLHSVVRRGSHGAMHIGRGGTGNVVKTGDAEDGAPLVRMKSPAPPATDKDKNKTAARGGADESGRGDSDVKEDDGDVAVPAASG